MTSAHQENFLISFQTTTFLLLIIKKTLKANFYTQSMLKTFPSRSNDMFTTITVLLYQKCSAGNFHWNRFKHVI